MSTATKGRTHGCSDHCCTREENPCQPGAVHTWPIATADNLTARRRFRGIADMDRFSSRNDLQRMTRTGHARPYRITSSAVANTVSGNNEAEGIGGGIGGFPKPL